MLAVVGAVAGLVLATTTPRTYTATATAFVAIPGPVLLADRGEPVPRNGGWGAAQMLDTLASVATTPLVLRPVIRELRLLTSTAELARSVSVTSDGGSLLVRIAARDTSPTRAAAVANAIESRLAQVVGELTPSTGDRSTRIELVRPAVAAAASSSPGTPVVIALGATAGALVGLLVLALPALGRAARRPPPSGPAAPSMF